MSAILEANIRGGPPVTWERVRDAYQRMEEMGYQSVLQAIKVGEMLAALNKRSADQKDFVQRAGQNGIGKTQAFNLMKLAAHRRLLEKKRPESQRAALALIPPKRRRPAAAKPQPKEEGKDEEEDDYPDPTPEQYRLGFWSRVSTAQDCAKFPYPPDAPLDRDMVEAARACGSLWNDLARQLEERLRGGLP